jgi:hypothetical protein
MPHTPAIEDIEALRRLAGINDVELQEQIGHLRAGDCVRLTLLPDGRPSAVVSVRITSIKGQAFRGRVVTGPEAPAPWIGALVAFGPGHIHSVPKAGASCAGLAAPEAAGTPGRARKGHANENPDGR